MGQRITAKSTVDISYEKMTPVLPIPSSGPASFDSVSLLSSKLLTSPATPSRIPMRRASMTVRKTNSISSTATSNSDRSLTASPIKSSQSVMSVNNNNNGSNSSSGTNSNSDLVNGNGNWREIHSSPNKSRIPVLRSVSCKIPKNICFGHKSNQKAFTMKHWYQNHDSITNNERKDSLRDPNFAEDMKMALDN